MLKWARSQAPDRARVIQTGVCEIVTNFMIDNTDAIEIALESEIVTELMKLLGKDLPVEDVKLVHVASLKSMSIFGNPDQDHKLFEMNVPQAVVRNMKSQDANVTSETAATIYKCASSDLASICLNSQQYNNIIKPSFTTLIEPNQQSQSILQYSNSQQSSQSSLIRQNMKFNTSWNRKDFLKIKKIGKGGFGSVWLIQEKITQKFMAWKKIEYFEDIDRQNVNQEIEIMKEICNNLLNNTSQSSQFLHVVQPLGFFLHEDNRSAYLVLEYCSNGDMRHYIDDMKSKGTQISEKKSWEIIGQISSALHQLHINDIVHGDMKPENVLLTEEFKVKLADFGLAKKLQIGKEYTHARGGTFLYQAPEFLRSRNIEDRKKDKDDIKQNDKKQQRHIQTKASDIYSAGVMLYELLSQKHPFISYNDEEYDGVPIEEYIHRVINEDPDELPSHFSENIKNLIKQMLNKV
ncbi:MAG: putative NEK protein kinase [Streblomastix strix]|uniref:Putative NEK protein kinase n=1 Tax=Streblomastix strix TaxID=222440 RepID=A0A5J4WC07_9EUKA|nr:MAG: putative NEK protein kinase [Streblomastix strix]